MGPIWWTLVSVLASTAVEECAAVAKLQMVQHEGTYSKTMSFRFNQTTEHVLVFPTSQSMYPYRISAWSSNATVECPVLLVVRQEREVLSWQIPFVVDTSTRDGVVQFHNTSRTLCHNNMLQITKSKSFTRKLSIPLSQNFIVALSTSSMVNVEVSVIVEEERNFYLTENKKYSIAVSPSETKYYYYKFLDRRSTTAVVEITSDDDVCLTVSIQDSFCPVFDLDKDITYEGKYQTINRKGGMSIRSKEYPDGFFLVFVAKADNYECSQKHSLLPRGHKNSNIIAANRTSIVNFSIVKGINGKDYGVASLVTLCAIGAFYVFAIVMVFAFTRWGTLRSYLTSKARDTTDTLEGDADFVVEPGITAEDKKQLLTNNKLTVNLLARAPTKDRRRSYNYLWHILSIAIFYSIPVVQLVTTYQRVVNRTGDQDMCYYNFLCANPAWGVSDFNHIFSNVGYVFMGILFLCVVLYRHAKIPNNCTGIPTHYGVFYAMGIALTIEGLLSACYHICPSQSNYQFDTSFMYVMAVLCMIKLYQNRHPDVNATAYATFTVLGMAIFLGESPRSDFKFSDSLCSHGGDPEQHSERLDRLRRHLLGPLRLHFLQDLLRQFRLRRIQTTQKDLHLQRQQSRSNRTDQKESLLPLDRCQLDQLRHVDNRAVSVQQRSHRLRDLPPGALDGQFRPLRRLLHQHEVGARRENLRRSHNLRGVGDGGVGYLGRLLLGQRHLVDCHPCGVPPVESRVHRDEFLRQT
jgi:hypothetical protein